LTTVEGLAGWWSLGETTVEGDPGVRGPFTFRSRAVVTHLGVTALDPPAHLAWRATESNAPGGWDGTTITFDLTPNDKGTRLYFAHRGFAEDNEGYRKVTAGWAHYLQNLKRLIETGTIDP
jgi:uncharacterized protein YndB with AHSA1/START domain